MFSRCRVICMNLGRPAMVSLSTVESFPLPCETDTVDQISSNDIEPRQSLFSFFNCSARLYEIAQKILVSFYSSSGGIGARGFDEFFVCEHSLFKLDSELRTWYTTIPSFLHFDPGDITAGLSSCPPYVTQRRIFHRQAVVLYLRYVF